MVPNNDSDAYSMDCTIIAFSDWFMEANVNDKSTKIQPE